MQHKNLLMILSILIALLLPLGVALKSYTGLKSAEIIRVKIQAYDPRDLFYGQYMTYRFAWNWKQDTSEVKVCETANCCLCVGEGDVDPEVYLVSCHPKPSRQQCRGIIHGVYHASNFQIGNNRFYVDERHAYPLEQLFRQGQSTFRIGIGLSQNGKPHIENLYIDDQSLEDYLRSNGGNIPLQSIPQTP